VKRVFIAISILEVNAFAAANALRQSVVAAIYLAQEFVMADDRSRARKAADDVAARHWPNTHVREIVATAADASARRYLRCHLESAGGKAPQTVIVMLNEGTGAALSSDELGVFGKGGPAELPFLNVQRYLASVTDAVPAVYGCTANFAEVVLEDVGDIPVWEAANAAGADGEELFGRALDLLAELQTRAVDDGSGCYAFRQAFDQRLFDWEFEHFIEYGLEPADNRTVEACRRELGDVSRALAAMPRVFTHRDYHAWNLHVHEGRLRIIDFQDALLGPAIYDAASLLTDRITPRLLGDAAERRLIERFARAGAPQRFGGVDPHEAFVLCALQRVLKVIGRFNYLSEVKGKPRYAEMLPAVVPTARRLCSGRSALAATASLLETHVKGGAR
jgi:aminoglycoside/choline kinase family phosphotransferase